MFRYLLVLGALLGLGYACTPPVEEIITDVRIDFREKPLQRLLVFQDRRMPDSLYRYFRHPDPALRTVAAEAFGSLQTPAAVDSLLPLLRDPVEAVRVAAAYALGQIGEPRAELPLLRAFDTADTLRENVRFNRTVLEAVGKVGSAENLVHIATVSNYRPTDTLLLLGQAYAIYRYGLRGITAPAGTARAVTLATGSEFPAGARSIAAHYLARAEATPADDALPALVKAYREAPDPRVRMALATALGKLDAPAAGEALRAQLSRDADYRVRVNTIRALGNFAYADNKALLLLTLSDDNPHVARAAATYFREHGTAADAAEYGRLGRRADLPERVRVMLLTAANRHLPYTMEKTLGRVNYDLNQLFRNSKNDYVRADAVRGLAEFGWNYRPIKENAFPSDVPVIRTAAIEAFAQILRRPDFRTFFRGSWWRAKTELTEYLAEAIRLGDAGMIAAAAGVLRDKDLRFNEILTDPTFMQTALEKLNLPKEIETYNELKRTYEMLAGLPETAPLTVDYNHPIDWDAVEGVYLRPEAVIETARGSIRLQLLPAAAPATCANFLDLARSGFFSNKNFHRVVANFVAQGGGTRGDGYGSLDYTIRSELANVHYDAGGYVGMASAGKDTEGTQFFITHSPTPHLDGRYTIFARVIEGMEVVHQLLPGDKIKRVTLEPARTVQ